MEITFKFLKTARVAVITSANNKLLKDFLNCISEGNEVTVADCMQYDDADKSKELKLKTTNKIKNLKNVAKEKNSYCLLPIELLNCDRPVTAVLRSLNFHIPTNDEPDIQFFQIHYVASELRLECEFGENAGWYVIYDYDAVTGQFMEKE